MNEQELFAALDAPTRRDRNTLTASQRPVMMKRRGAASQSAKGALARLHPEEYKALYYEALRREEEADPIENYK